jgi:general secretion pathway protein J
MNSFLKINMKRQTGMTLLEVLIALVIFIIISAAGYSGLQQGIAVQNQLQQQQQTWRKIDALVMLIESDLEQAKTIAPRVPLWDAIAFRGYSNEGDESFGELIKFTRGGYQSYLRLNVNPFQRTAYRLRDGVLYRVTWPGVDLPEYEQGIESELIDNIQGIELKYLAENRRWVDNWPLRFTPEDSLSVPGAVVMTITTVNDLSIKRVFYVGPPK